MKHHLVSTVFFFFLPSESCRVFPHSDRVLPGFLFVFVVRTGSPGSPGSPSVGVGSQDRVPLGNEPSASIDSRRRRHCAFSQPRFSFVFVSILPRVSPLADYRVLLGFPRVYLVLSAFT